MRTPARPLAPAQPQTCVALVLQLQPGGRAPLQAVEEAQLPPQLHHHEVPPPLLLRQARCRRCRRATCWLPPARERQALVAPPPQEVPDPHYRRQASPTRHYDENRHRAQRNRGWTCSCPRTGAATRLRQCAKVAHCRSRRPWNVASI